VSGRSRHEPSGDQLVASAVLGLLSSRGPSSRAELARSLGVSAATLTHVTRDLLSRGLLTELEHVASNGGRPARLLGLARPVGTAVGAKVAVDHVAVVEVGLDAQIRDSDEHPFDAFAPDALDRLGHLLAGVLAERSDVLGVGIGLPGSVDAQATGSVTAPTLGWTEAPVGALLRSTLGVPVLVENDVNTLAVAERLYGVGRDHASYVVVTIGRGVGCGIVVDGEVYRGSRGGAGEIGHIPVSDDGPGCRCGSRGCLEAHVGQDALLQTARAAGVVGPDEGIAALRRAAESGDPRACQLYRSAGAVLGRALAGVVHTLDPEIVVLLGEGLDAWRLWEPGFEPAFRRHLMPARRGLPFMVEPWADDKWALGAASLVLASSFDASGVSGEQGRLVRQRLGSGPAVRATRAAATT